MNALGCNDRSSLPSSPAVLLLADYTVMPFNLLGLQHANENSHMTGRQLSSAHNRDNLKQTGLVILFV